MKNTKLNEILKRISFLEATKKYYEETYKTSNKRWGGITKGMIQNVNKSLAEAKEEYEKELTKENETREYIGTYKMSNGCFFDAYTKNGKIIDANGIVITRAELKEYQKVN